MGGIESEATRQQHDEEEDDLARDVSVKALVLKWTQRNSNDGV